MTHISQYRTSCSICRLGIYDRQKAVWTRGQHLGFSHQQCAADLCPLCGKRFEGLSRSGATACTLCALVVERHGPMQELLQERFEQRAAA